MRTLILTALLSGTALLADCGGITSQTIIEAGQQFVLGGGQPGAFRVAAHNVGSVPVSVAERLADGAVQERGRLEPSPRTELTLEAGSAALARNLGERRARMNFWITGSASSGLGMRYEAVKKIIYFLRNKLG